MSLPETVSPGCLGIRHIMVCASPPRAWLVDIYTY